MEPDRDAIPHGDPLALFEAWLAEAVLSEPNDPNAMAVASAIASASFGSLARASANHESNRAIGSPWGIASCSGSMPQS